MAKNTKAKSKVIKTVEEPIVEEPIVAEKPKDNTELENILEPVNIPDEPFKTLAELIVACNTIESALTLIGEIRKRPSKVKAEKIAKPKKVTNTEAVLRVLTETGKTTVDEVAKKLMEVHGTKNLSQAIHLIETVHNHGVNTLKTKVDGVKFIELV